MWDTLDPDKSDNLSASELLDKLMTETVGGSKEDNYEQGISAAAGVSKADYNKLYAFRNVISYSMEGVLNDCPKKFELSKLQAASAEGRRRINNVDFAFGHALGAAVAVFDKTQDLRAASWAAFLAWDIDLFAKSVPKSENGWDPKKSFPDVIYALEKYAEWYNENMMDQYEVVEIEATILVDLQTQGVGANGMSHTDEQPTQFYTGHIDEILRHKISGNLRVKENKTTGARVIHPAMYANSNQALSYSVVIGEYGCTEYDVLYTVYSTSEQRWISFDFTKHELAKAEWLRTELIQADQLQVYAENNHFPKRGDACFKFNRECEFFGQCNISTRKQFGMTFAELEVADEAALQAVERFQFVVTKEDLIKSIRNRTRKE